MSVPLYAISAEFDEPEALTKAVRAAKRAGYTRFDAFAPYPVQAVADELGVRTSVIPLIAAITGLIGAAVQYYAQYWMNVVDYPINVGGRPLHSWPTFIPATIIVAVLWAGVATLVGLLIILRLPRPHHPVFETPGFTRASEDRCFLLLLADDPRFDTDGSRRFLEELAPLAVQEVPRCD